MSYTFTAKPGTTVTIPVNTDLTGFTLKLVLDRGGASAPVEVTSGLVAGSGQVTLDIPSGTSIFSRRRTAYRLVGTKNGTDSTLQRGMIYGESTLDDDNIEVTVVPDPAGNLIKTVQEKYRDDFAGTALNPDFWTVSTGPGMTVAVTNSELRIDTGTTANAVTIIRSKKSWSGSYRVMFVGAATLLSQRIANQEFELRVVNAAGTSLAGWTFTGVTATTGAIRSSNNGASLSDVNVTTINSTAFSSIYEIENFIDEVYFHSRAADSVNSRVSTNARNRQTPDPNEDMFIEIRVRNGATAPASNTRLSLDAVLIQDISELTTEITGGRGGGGASQAIPVTTVGSSVAITGTPNVNISNTSLVTANTIASASLSATNLTANASFTQTAVDQGTSALLYGTRTRAVVLHLAGLTPGLLKLEQSTDGTTYRETFRQAIPSDGLVHTFEAPLYYRYYRWIFTNGATAQTSFSLGYSTNRGEGPTDIDKVLTFLLTAAAGQALAANAVFTSPTIDIGGNHQWDQVKLIARSDVANAANGLAIEHSSDGTNWHRLTGVNLTSGQAVVMEQPVVERYVRAVNTQGAGAGTAFFAALTLYSN